MWGLIFILALLPFNVASAQEVALYLSPEQGSYSIGETFNVRMMANTGGASITAVEAELTFDPEVFAVESISTDESVLTSWPTQPLFSNVEGSMKFSGWANTPFTGSTGLLVNIRFRALRNGVSSAHIASGAMIAADGRGSNVITSMRSGVYTIEPQQVVPLPVIPEAASETSTETSPEMAPVAAPIISERPGVLSVGDRIIVKGLVHPNARVHVSLEHDGEAHVSSIMSAGDGTFTFVSDQGAAPGVYRLWVEAEGEGGVKSSASEKISITVAQNGLVAAAQTGAELATALVPLAGILAFAGLGIGYLVHRHQVTVRKQDELTD